MLINDRRRVLSRFRKRQGRLVWFGGNDGRRQLFPGEYEIRLRAIDKAGNRSARTRAVTVRVRYVELVPDRIEAVAGRRFSIGVSTDARVYRWVFNGRKGKYRKRILVLRAPETPGTYVLYAVVGRWASRAEVVVTAPPQP
jgi:hypothetical protein